MTPLPDDLADLAIPEDIPSHPCVDPQPPLPRPQAVRHGRHGGKPPGPLPCPPLHQTTPPPASAPAARHSTPQPSAESTDRLVPSVADTGRAPAADPLTSCSLFRL
jgi:hypothetical protein